MSTKNIYLIAICGTGMSALAGMLQSQGYQVSGSDLHVYPPMSDYLAARKIPIYEGFEPAHLNPRPDQVVIGNAVSLANPEAQTVLKEKIPYLSMPGALSRFFLADKDSIVIAGTHGKTTTSAIMAWLLYQLGLDPGYFIGGILRNFESNWRLGTGRYFVIEGDEYDTAFFDKAPKFIHYRPKYTVLTGIEFDHADIYAHLGLLKEAFQQLIYLLPRDGLLVAYGDNRLTRELLHSAPCPVVTYGLTADNEWSLADISGGPAQAQATVLRRGRSVAKIAWPIPGRHNLLNALAVIALLEHQGIPPEQSSAALEGFLGVKRRQELRGEEQGIMVFDDFAHHPTAVKETILALKELKPTHRLVAVFEPRTNTSRRKVFQEDYAASFGDAQEVLIKEAFQVEKIQSEERFSSRRLVDDLIKRGQNAKYFSDTDSLLNYLVPSAQAGDLILIMSNGGFDNIHSRLLNGLKTRR